MAGLSQEEARELLLQRLTESLEAERGVLIRRFQEENKQRLLEDAQEIMITAMQRYAGDCTYERTTSTIPLPNEEMKGRIIGREGRNIRTIEAATGVNVLIDDTPEAVVISCFDPIRRKSRITMERRSPMAASPARRGNHRQYVGTLKPKSQAGQDAVTQLGVTRLRQGHRQLLGRLKYRWLLPERVMHSIEVASMMGVIAAQLGLDNARRRAGLLLTSAKLLTEVRRLPPSALICSSSRRRGRHRQRGRCAS